jgi:hypothetical protein
MQVSSAVTDSIYVRSGDVREGLCVTPDRADQHAKLSSPLVGQVG